MFSQYISIESLTNGEKIALGAFEVTSCPHISIIDNGREDVGGIIERYKNETSSLLSELFQNYKMISLSDGYSKDVSFELLWKSTKVYNQPYNASITMIIIVRAIDNEADRALNIVSNMLKVFQSTLKLQKYDFKEISYNDLSQLVSQIDDSNIKAIVKEEKVENLQNQILPFCYSYDRIPRSNSDFSKLINALIDYPDCAISFQLIPTIYNNNEINELDKTTQMLETLNRGVMDHSVGNISFTMAERPSIVYKYYSERKSSALFAFNILIYGSSIAISNISTQVFGQLSIGNEAQANLKLNSLSANEVGKNSNFCPLPWAVNEVLINKERDLNIWNSGQFSNGLYRLPYIITSEEAAEFFRLPIGSDKISAGLKINESGKGSKTYTDNIINTGDIIVGKLKSSSKSDTIGLSLKDLAKHMLIVGTPGSGKTTFSVSLLDRLWKEHKIPFLVIEPAKNEYRALVQSIPNIQVFTPGKNFISPFVFNPFVLPKNVKLETYKSTLKTAFAAAVSMSTPLDKIFEEAINNCYSDFRWLDTYTIDDKGRVFNISDFIKCFQNTFDEIGYTGDAKNIGRAGLVRLQSLVNLFDNYFSIPIEDLLTKPTVIELAAIENRDQKALIISLLLLSILVYVNSNYIGEGSLRNVILLEEAHVLLDADTNVGQGEANPSAIAQGLVKRMLAEIRSYGVGIVIADQSPRKVTTDVVALTDIKLAFRLVEATDKQIISDSTNMNQTQVQRLAKLKPGEAFLFFGKLDEPEEIKTEDYRLANNISITLTDEGIKSLSTYWNERKDKLRPYPECAYCQYCNSGCDYAKRILSREIARRIFVKNFKPDSSDSGIVKGVFRQMELLIKQELNDELFDRLLFACVELHLIRRIRYGTKIKISDATVQKTLSKI